MAQAPLASPLMIVAGPVMAKIVDCPPALRTKINDLLSFDVEGREHMARFQMGHWSGRSSFYSSVNDSFPAGFLHMIHGELVKLGVNVQVARKKAPEPLGPENPIVDVFGNDDPRYDYQMRAVAQVLKHRAGILQVATGGGKSKIAKLLIARIRRPTLFLTTRGVLLYQMAEQLEEMKFRVGYVGDGAWSPTKGVNVGMVQTLVATLEEPNLNRERQKAMARLVRKDGEGDRALAHKLAQERFDEKTALRERAIKLLETIEFVIGEEAHEAGGNSYYEILKHCKNAHYRVALTATPFMRDNVESNMRLMAAFGPILLKVSEKTLIDRGILAKPYFRFVVSQPHEKLRKTTPWQRAFDLGYMQNVHMFRDVLKDAIKAKRVGMPVLSLVSRKEQGQKLADYMNRFGVRAVFLQGENDNDERKQALNGLKTGELDAIVGTTILDVGVDVPAVGLVQLCAGGKAEVSLRQRIGRGLRAKKSGANIAFVADYSTSVATVLREHAKQRRNVIESTPGFVEGILPDGQDFPWAQFLNAKAA